MAINQNEKERASSGGSVGHVQSDCSYATALSMPHIGRMQCQHGLLLTGEVNLDPVLKLMPAGFLPCKITTFPFVFANYLREDFLRPCKYPVSP